MALGNWLGSSTLPALEQTANFAQKRHMLLAGNIANFDVPGYQTRDLSLDDFHSALRDSIDAQHSPSRSYRSQSAPSAQEAHQRVRDVSSQVMYHDGSDVSLEQQVTEISKNQSMHNMSIALMRSHMQTLQVAIRESVAV